MALGDQRCRRCLLILHKSRVQPVVLRSKWYSRFGRLGLPLMGFQIQLHSELMAIELEMVHMEHKSQFQHSM
jgi:hypothetical protein